MNRARSRHARRRRSRGDRPRIAPPGTARRRPGEAAFEAGLFDWVEYGGELIFAVGFTPAGVPYGVRAEDLDGWT